MMQNEPVPTAGHWNIMDIYSPGQKKSHHVARQRSPWIERETTDHLPGGNPMRHEYSLAHLTVLSLSPPQMVEAAARTGYEYVGLRLTRVTPAEPLYDLAHDRALMKETKARLAATGVRVLDIELFRMDPSLEPEQLRPRARRDRRARRAAHHRAASRPGSRSARRRVSPRCAISRQRAASS